jgi:rare lipoprotein A
MRSWPGLSALLLISAITLGGCSTLGLKPQVMSQLDVSEEKCGKASWYGPGFHNKQTANQEIFDQNAMTAAHRTLPYNSHVKVTDRATGKAVTVRINDRGPFIQGRIVDLSAGAAAALGMQHKGVTAVCLEVL